MKLIVLVIVFLFLSLAFIDKETKNKEKELSALIRKISLAVDTQNKNLLNQLLNENYNFIMHQFPTDDQTTILTKKNYLILVEGGQMGGKKRKVRIKSLDITNNIASAKIEYISNNLVLKTYQTFILNKNNVWQIISDIPDIKNNIGLFNN